MPSNHQSDLKPLQESNRLELNDDDSELEDIWGQGQVGAISSSDSSPELSSEEERLSSPDERADPEEASNKGEETVRSPLPTIKEEVSASRVIETLISKLEISARLNTKESTKTLPTKEVPDDSFGSSREDVASSSGALKTGEMVFSEQGVPPDFNFPPGFNHVKLEKSKLKENLEVVSYLPQDQHELEISHPAHSTDLFFNCDKFLRLSSHHPRKQRAGIPEVQRCPGCSRPFGIPLVDKSYQPGQNVKPVSKKNRVAPFQTAVSCL